VARTYDAIDDRIEAFIRQQHVFFVASAPSGPDGHVNVSPKGLDTFAVLGPRLVAYLDLVGSGAETIAHLRENGRLTLMFCSFEGPPRTLRLYGRGEVIEPGDEAFEGLRSGFPAQPATRSVVRVHLDRIADSCGYGVPLYRFEGERAQLCEWAKRKGADGLRRYQLEHNRSSLDGLPALRGERLSES
jgi:hypothetical protein